MPDRVTIQLRGQAAPGKPVECIYAPLAETVDGRRLDLTPEDISAMAEGFTGQEGRIAVTLNHRGDSGVAEEARALGWVQKLYAQAEGAKTSLMAVIDWLPDFRARLAAGQFKFVSCELLLSQPPVFAGLSVTNDPAVPQLAPIELSKAPNKLDVGDFWTLVREEREAHPELSQAEARAILEQRYPQFARKPRAHKPKPATIELGLAVDLVSSYWTKVRELRQAHPDWSQAQARQAVERAHPELREALYERAVETTDSNPALSLLMDRAGRLAAEDPSLRPADARLKAAKLYPSLRRAAYGAENAADRHVHLVRHLLEEQGLATLDAAYQAAAHIDPEGAVALRARRA
jgi:hypothetical protein